MAMLQGNSLTVTATGYHLRAYPHRNLRKDSGDRQGRQPAAGPGEFSQQDRASHFHPTCAQLRPEEIKSDGASNPHFWETNPLNTETLTLPQFHSAGILESSNVKAPAAKAGTSTESFREHSMFSEASNIFHCGHIPRVSDKPVPVAECTKPQCGATASSPVKQCCSRRSSEARDVSQRAKLTRQSADDENSVQKPKKISRARSPQWPVHFGLFFYSAVHFALLLLQEAQGIVTLCLWQILQKLLLLSNNLLCHCSFGLNLVAVGLLRKFHDGEGGLAVSVRAFARLLRMLGTLMERTAATALAAESKAASKMLAARRAAIKTAAVVGSKWTTLATWVTTLPYPASTDSARTKKQMRAPQGGAESNGNLPLTPEEALATACDLWASMHLETPSKHLSVLEFQDLLRKRFSVKDGLLYLVPKDRANELEAPPATPAVTRRGGLQQILSWAFLPQGNEPYCTKPLSLAVYAMLQRAHSAYSAYATVLGRKFRAACGFAVAASFNVTSRIWKMLRGLLQ